MQYRVEELAGATGVGVDTIRFYQGRGLIDPPARRGRIAFYDESHAERLRRIRELQAQGFTLDQIRRVVSEPERNGTEPLLSALVDARIGARSLTLDELAAETGVPPALVRAAVAAGLVEPLEVDGEQRFSEADVEMARLGLALLESGFPLQELLEHAVRHASQVRDTCDAAIELFDTHVRRQEPTAGDLHAITDAFQKLLPAVTRLVAVHFQRTLVTRALQRLEGSAEREPLEAALAALEQARLEVEVAWR